MKKLFIIIIIFLFISCVSATEDNNTSNNLTNINTANHASNIEINNNSDGINSEPNITMDEKELEAINFNSTSNITPKNNTIHIINVENSTFEETCLILLKFDKIKNNMNEIRIIVSNESGIVYKHNEYIDIDENGRCDLRLEPFTYDFDDNLIINLNPGKYNITIINLKDLTNDTFKFKIFKPNIDFFEFPVVITPFSLTFDISVNYQIKKKSYIKVELKNNTEMFSKESIKPKSDESVEITFYNLLPGKYIASFYCYIDKNYNIINYTETVELFKEDTNLNAYHEINNDKIDLYISMNITPSENNLTITIDNQIKKIPVQNKIENLKITFENLLPGNYEAILELPSNSRYSASKICIPFNISKNNENITNLHDIINETKNITENNTQLNVTSNSTSNSNNNNINYDKKSDTQSQKNNKKIKNKAETRAGSYNEEKPLSNINSYEISKKQVHKSIINKSSPLLIISIIIMSLIFIISINKKEYDEY